MTHESIRRILHRKHVALKEIRQKTDDSRVVLKIIVCGIGEIILVVVAADLHDALEELSWFILELGLFERLHFFEEGWEAD